MIICSYSNIDIIQGVIGYGDAEGIADWRIANTSNGILNILNSSSDNTRISINTNGNVGIGSKDPSTITDLLDVSGNINISGIYEINNRDVINDTSNYVLSTSNILVNRIVSSTTGGGGGTSQWTNVSSGIYYNTSNVGIGTAVVESKLHIYDAITNTTKLTIQNASPDIIPTALPTEIIVSGTTRTIIGTLDRCIQFPYSGSGTNVSYSFTPTQTLICEILVVGGGGSGGGNGGGGGGAGGYVYATNVVLTNGYTYNVSVGRGGIGTYNANTNGNNSSITGAISYTALGGGKGGGRDTGNRTSESGGSGGGGGGSSEAVASTGQASIQNSTYGYGIGFAGRNGFENGANSAGGGGGGAGGLGTTGTFQLGGNGGNGVSNSITGSSVIYCAGGGGGVTVFGSAGANGSSGNGSFGSGSKGGNGGIGSPNGSNGIVIIKYRLFISSTSSIELIRGVSGDSNIDYKIGNYVGEFKIQASVNNTDTDYVRITSAGASIYNPTGSPQWSTTSDRRIKENIEKASYDICYDNINKLDLYRFNYINGFNNVNKDLRQLGYIAQEVQDIFPKAVSSYNFDNKDISIPDLLSIDITQINYSLYGAVKKLIAIDKDKENRINKLIEINEDNEVYIKRLETLLNIDIDTSNLSIDTSNLSIDTSNLPIDTSNLSIDTSNLSIDTSNLPIDTSNLSIDTSNLSIDTSNLPIDTSNIAIE
jgi:hypothetical protein